MTLFQKIKGAGIPYSNHFSDLYIKDCVESRKILSQYERANGNATTFINQINNERWINVPFNYDPYWEKVARICSIPAN